MNESKLIGKLKVVAGIEHIGKAILGNGESEIEREMREIK